MNLADTTAVVTGAARGIGRAIATGLAKAGGAVWLLDIDATLDATVADLRDQGLPAHGLQVDVSDAAAVAGAFAAVSAAGPAAHLLVNNAAIQGELGIEEIDDETWARQLAVTLTGAFYCTRAAVPGMRAHGFGRIVSVSSIAAQRGSSLACHYGAAKAGVEGLTRSLARELGGDGITVNAIAPGFVVTPMTAERAGSRREHFMAQIPVQRFARPEDLVEPVLLLLGPGGHYINGQTIHVNGGWYL